ncbi:putative metal-binding protein [Bradymonas sediminis]|nr:putative metal-binding motif-containing protein [Bradymonas sediminis]TDP75376.1 putative metal-binding protein [Bradymonas sediminis]
MSSSVYKSMLCVLFAMLVGCTEDSPTQRQDLRDSGVSDTGQADVRASDADRDTATPDASADDISSDASSADADTAEPPTGRTLSDYRRCQSNLDCPVGLGVCVKEVSLSRANAAGETRVAMTDIFVELGEDEGVCSLDCTSSADVCAALSVNGIEADARPHTCQLVTTAEAPYPEVQPAFPFDAQLDSIAQLQGQAFGAICRAPFELAPAVSDAFCERCDGPDSCGDGTSLCWSAKTDAAAQDGESGQCLTPCEGDDTCPMGFACDVTDADGQSYCRPALGTCTACQDRDQDGFGTGQCGTAESPVTPHDCDDLNPQAYYDPDNMDHAFPATCGEQDFNCNGLSDAVEQISASDYPEEHCGGCFDTCAGTLPNGQKFCQQSATPGVGECAAQCETDADGVMLYADCDGDLSNGCEVEANDPSRQFYRDADGDGYGDPNDRVFDCGDTGAPAGYVANADDCDDTSSAAHGGANPPAELCDGLDNDCNGDVDDSPTDAALGLNCADSGYLGACKAGHNVCEGGQIVCAPDILPGEQAETCATPEVDDDCDGSLFNAQPEDHYRYYYDNDGDNYGDGVVLSCSATPPPGTSVNWGDCNDSDPEIRPLRQEICGDQIDNNCSGQTDTVNPIGANNEPESREYAVNAKVWYRDTDGDGYGDPANQVHKCVDPAPGSGWVLNGDDCDVNDSTKTLEQTYYYDGDGDGFIDVNNSISSCGRPGNIKYILPPFGDPQVKKDCHDGESRIHPGAGETCNGRDNDCNGVEDDAAECPIGDGLLSWAGSYSAATNPNHDIGASGNHANEPGGLYSPVCPAGSVWSAARVNYRPDHGNPNGVTPLAWIEPGCQEFQLEKLAAGSFTGDNQYSLKKRSGPINYIGGHSSIYQGGNQTEVFTCAANEAIYRVDIRSSGGLTSQVSFYCRPYRVTNNNGLTAYVFEQESNSGTAQSFGHEWGGYEPQSCGANQVAVGLSTVTSRRNTIDYGNTNVWNILRVRVACADLELPTY